jgi:uncharacterized protein (UPF0332 family)
MERSETVGKLKWCFRIKEGFQIVESNDNLSKSYLEEAKSSLKRAEKDLEDGDLLWSSVIMYYAEYYSLYSFLQKIGIKCENHSFSIALVEYLIGVEKTKIINEHKEKRIDAQYYMRTGKREQVSEMLKECKEFILEFDTLVSMISEEEVKSYRNKVIEITKKKEEEKMELAGKDRKESKKETVKD